MPEDWVEKEFEAQKAEKAVEELKRDADSAAAFNPLFSVLTRRMQQDIGAYNQRVNPSNRAEVDSRYPFAVTIKRGGQVNFLKIEAGRPPGHAEIQWGSLLPYSQQKASKSAELKSVVSGEQQYFLFNGQPCPDMSELSRLLLRPLLFGDK